MLTMSRIQNTRMKLEIETRQLQRSWKEFQESLRYQEQKQQPEDLIREMRAAIDYWSAHRQRVLFRKSIKWAQECLGTMDGHVILMQALPDPKRYCELFFGVVYSIVRVILSALNFCIQNLMTTGRTRTIPSSRSLSQISGSNQPCRHLSSSNQFYD
jgi:hypothetical protein